MVEIKVKQPDPAYFTSGAVSKKETPAEIRFSHARICKELNQSENCKITVEKKLTRSQEQEYNMILKDQRDKECPGRKRKK
jgi:hypothetical protein